MLGHLAVCLCCALLAQANPEVDFDFRGKRFDASIFRTEQISEPFVHPEERGLRITMPGKDGPSPPRATGIYLPTVLSGDFEITVGYEVLAIEEGGAAPSAPGCSFI